MTRGPNSTWISVQLSPAEQQVLDERVAEEQKKDPKMNRNRFIRAWIATLRRS